MAINNTLLKGNIVATYKVGNSTIEIRDSAYINNTPEDEEKILKRLSKIALEIAIKNCPHF